MICSNPGARSTRCAFRLQGNGVPRGTRTRSTHFPRVKLATELLRPRLTSCRTEMFKTG